MSNLLDLATQDTMLKRAASTNGGEYCGPCPGCGGRDRFHMWPEKGRYWCRQCGKKGDAIQYLRDFRGLSFVEAKRALGMDTSPASRQAQAKARAHRRALAAARDAYDSWQRRRLVELTDEYRELVTESEIAAIAYRATHRCPGLYSGEDRHYWTRRLSSLYDHLTVLEHDLDVLTYNRLEAERFKWWTQEGEMGHGQLAA